jgi:hypothetical protein
MIARRGTVPKNGMKTLTVAAAISCTLITTAHAAMTISNAKTKNVNCSGGACTPTGGNANLNVSELVTLLASSDITVKSNAAAPDIGILDPLTWASSYRLTLDAYESIHVRAPVVVEGTAGVTLITDDGGSGGDYNFNTATSGAIAFWDWKSSLIINGKNFALEKDIQTLAIDIAVHPSRNFALIRDYDAPHSAYRNSPIQGAFAGTFEGLGHTISNLFIKTGDPVHKTGLFAELGPRGTVRDIGLVNANVAGGHGELSSGVVGPLVAENDGKIVNAYATGTVSGRRSITGGLAGSSTGTVAMSYSTMKVACVDGQAGGLVGSMQGGLIESSHATGSVDCAGGAGGLVGAVSAGRILYSFATGPTTAYGSNVAAGGLTVSNAGTIAFCFATGDATAQGSEGEEDGEGYAGGLTVYNRGTIHDAFATGKVSAGPFTDAGGLVEENRGSISNTYSTGTVKADQRGGLLGQDYSTTATSYWDLDTSGISNPHQGAGDPLDDPGITGLTDAQLKSALPAGFDPNVWGQSASVNNGWPYLLANPPQ